MRQQITISLEESSMVIFLLDGKEGLLPQDMEIAKGLRRYGKPIFFTVNKVDSGNGSAYARILYLARKLSVSSLHGWV